MEKYIFFISLHKSHMLKLRILRSLDEYLKNASSLRYFQINFSFTFSPLHSSIFKFTAGGAVKVPDVSSRSTDRLSIFKTALFI